MDLQNQFKRLIRKNGKYSSGIYGKKGLFLERMKYTYIFDGGNFFKIEKSFILIYKFFNIKIFLIEKTFIIKKFFHIKTLKKNFFFHIKNYFLKKFFL